MDIFWTQYFLPNNIQCAALTYGLLFYPQRSDYINASYMDGYKQKNAYIGTQGKTVVNLLR